MMEEGSASPALDLLSLTQLLAAGTFETRRVTLAGIRETHQWPLVGLRPAGAGRGGTPGESRGLPGLAERVTGTPGKTRGQSYGSTSALSGGG